LTHGDTMQSLEEIGQSSAEWQSKTYLFSRWFSD